MFGLGFTPKAALVLTPILLGAIAVGGRLDLQPESQLWVDGTSTVRSFRCNAGIVEADIVTTRADAATALIAGEKVVTGVAVRIPAAALDCNNGTMNGHMRKALKANDNPTIAFELGSYDFTQSDQALRTKLVGKLSLGGATKDVTIDAALTPDPAGGLRVKGSHDLRMTEYGLKPPSLMLGTMKVNDIVTVNFDLLLKD
jgi:polyisoprenoid-binding protein YceI